MPHEVWLACCLVLVLEGLLLALLPATWQRMMAELSRVDPRRLRLGGIAAMVVGMLCLKLVQSWT